MQFATATSATFILALVAAASTTAQTTIEEANHDNPLERIIGGFPSDPSAFPFFTTIVDTSASLCGASLIHNDFVMTAAHCIDAFQDGVRIGVQDRNNANEGLVRRVVVTFMHPQYSETTMANDILLLQLDQLVVGIDPVAYAISRTTPSAGDTLTVIGVGTTSMDEDFSPILLQVDVDTVSNSICAEEYKEIVDIDGDVMFCAGVPSGGKDSCPGDSGKSPSFGLAGITKKPC
jgi:secreted trypsin-like serine protease